MTLFWNKEDCDIKITLKTDRCSRVDFEDVVFDDNPEHAQTFLWEGTEKELQQYLNSPFGAMTMFEARRHGPVDIIIGESE